jgi:hypothetical protein
LFYEMLFFFREIHSYTIWKLGVNRVS